MHRSKPNRQLTPGTTSDKRNTMEAKPPTPPTQNVAFAVNYSLPSVDQFVATVRTPADQRVQATARSTKKDDTSKAIVASEQEASAPPPQRAQLAEKDMNRGKRDDAVVDDPTTPTTTPAKRSSNRDRKPREKTREKVRVRYDMNHVPVVQRHDRFMAHHRRSQVVSHHPTKRRAWPPRRSTRTAAVAEHNHDDPESTCLKCKGEELPAPFVADSSVVWIPTKRTEWEDCLSEMTAVCTSAALRRHVANKDIATSKPFFAPLSQAYIRDRIDIDDPLEGYQIRHKTGGWLQGFILWTNFTTWTHYFKWDSLDERSGVLAGQNVDETRLVDSDGSLSAELEAQTRSGDPLTTGLVFPTIAEIGLLGGIGCGEYLLRMAIDDIKSRGQYKYIVMQATDASKTFYERFGFVRVGAVCRYGSNAGQAGRACPQQQTAATTTATETDIVGYRHWTYANERNLDTYGGPSYMMALRLPSDDGVGELTAECTKCSSEVQKPSVIEQLKAVAVDEKPKVAQLGATSTPFKKASLLPLPKPVAPDAIRTSPYPPGVKRRGRPPKWPPTSKPKPAVAAFTSSDTQVAKQHKRSSKTTKKKAVAAAPVKKKAPAKHRVPGKYPPGAKKRGRPPKTWPPEVKRGPGRPRKYPLPEPIPAKPAPSTITDVSDPPKKKGPGRPRKYPLPESKKRGPGRPRKHPLPEPVIESGVKRKRASTSSSSSDTPNRKQLRTAETVSSLEEQREIFMAPVSEGEKLSFSQKQYQSVWLAVPPTKTASVGRRPPRQREAFMGNPAYFRKKRQIKAEEASVDDGPAPNKSDQDSKKMSPYPPGVKRRGRPPKKSRDRPFKKSATKIEEPNVSPYPPGVKRRGRPPKKAPSLVEESKAEKVSPYPPGVKRRGRPPKKAPSSEEPKMEAKVETILRRSPRRA